MKIDEIIGNKFISCKTCGDEIESFVRVDQILCVHARSENSSIIFTNNQQYICNLDLTSIVHEIVLLRN